MQNYTATFRLYTPYSKKVDINLQAHLGFSNTQFSWGSRATWQTKDPSAKPKEIFIYFITHYEDTTFNFFVGFFRLVCYLGG